MGNTPSFLPTLFPPSPKWTVEQVPDLTNKVVLITGGNAGIGKESVKILLQRNAKVYLACRSEQKAQHAIDELKSLIPHNVPIFLELDLASLASVRKTAETFLSKEKELHVLFNNGGVMSAPVELTTADGYDLQFGTNVIGHWLLTELLMPALLAAHAANPSEKPRVITVASNGAYLMRRFRYDTLVDGPARRTLAPMPLYFQSKFGNVVVARELARRHGDKIISISLHPGGIRTELQRHRSGFGEWLTQTIFLYPVQLGVVTQLYAGTAPEAADLNGKFLIPWARVGTPPLTSDDPEVGARLWAWLEEQTRDK